MISSTPPYFNKTACWIPTAGTSAHAELLYTPCLRVPEYGLYCSWCPLPPTLKTAARKRSPSLPSFSLPRCPFALSLPFATFPLHPPRSLFLATFLSFFIPLAPPPSPNDEADRVSLQRDELQKSESMSRMFAHSCSKGWCQSHTATLTPHSIDLTRKQPFRRSRNTGNTVPKTPEIVANNN
jgi:hypothetical protein